MAGPVKSTVKERRNSKLRKTLQICRDFGVKSVKIEGVEIELFESLPPKLSSPKADNSPEAELVSPKDLSRDFTFFSVPEFDEEIYPSEDIAEKTP